MKFILILILASMPLSGFAQTQVSRGAPSVFKQKIEQEILLRLRAHHDAPTASELEKISPEARAVVTQVVRQGSGFMRDRAIMALATWGDEEVWSILAPIFINTATHEITRHQLLTTLAQNFGDKSLGLVDAWLTSSDREKRLTAAQALAEVNSERSLALAQKRAESETDQDVKRLLERSIR